MRLTNRVWISRQILATAAWTSSESFDPLAVALARRQPLGVVRPVKAFADTTSIFGVACRLGFEERALKVV